MIADRGRGSLASDGLRALRPFGTGGDGGIVRADVERSRGILALRWVLGGATARLVLPPPPLPPRRADHLWEHTCFEAFLAPAGGDAYWELNLAPGGDWNVYRFDTYRAGMRAEPRATAPAVRLERASCGTVTVHATVDVRTIPELTSAALDVSLAAVLEASDGSLAYWALHHAAARPDFHRRQSFVMHLGAEAHP
jgi:hypothetical protein